MDFVVDTTLPAHIVIGATGLVGLAQEVRTLLATRKGSVPLDRDFGVDWSFVDSPVSAAMPRIVTEYARLRRAHPRRNTRRHQGRIHRLRHGCRNGNPGRGACRGRGSLLHHAGRGGHGPCARSDRGTGGQAPLHIGRAQHHPFQRRRGCGRRRATKTSGTAR